MRVRWWPYLFFFLPILFVGCENRLKSHLAEQKEKMQIAGVAFAATPLKGDSSSYTKVFGSYDAIRVALSKDQYVPSKEFLKRYFISTDVEHH